MESYERDLNKYLDLQEQQEIAYLQFESEVFEDVKELSEIDCEKDKLADMYGDKVCEYVNMLSNYIHSEYDFKNDLLLIKQVDKVQLELQEIDKQIEQLQEAYDNKLANLVDIARRYGSHEYDFTEDLMNLTKQI